MKMKRFLAGLMTAAMIVASVPAAGLGGITAEAADITAVPDVTVTAPSAGQSQADAVLTTGINTNVDFNTEGVEISDDGGISGKLTATNDAANAVFNVTGTTKLLLHFQMKSGQVDHTESIIGKMNSQYGVQITSEKLLFYARFEDSSSGEQWPQVSYTIPSDWWNKWHDVVAYYDGNALHMYVDGNEATDDRTQYRGAIREDADSIFTIGYNNNPLPADTADPEGNKQKFFGELKDVAMYTGTNVPTVDTSGKTADQIKAAYASELAGKTSIFTLSASEPEAGYSIKSTTWTPKENKFDAYKDYRVTVVLKADSGNTFPANASAILRTREEELSGAAITLNSARDEMTITYTFTGEEHPRDTLLNYLQSDAVTSVGTVENGLRVNKDANGVRKYTAASWNTFIEAFNTASAVAADENLAAGEYTAAKNRLESAIGNLALAENTCECVLGDITGFEGGSIEVFTGGEKKVTLGGESIEYTNDCIRHPGSEPQRTYALVGNPAGAVLEGNVLKLTAEASAVQVRLTVILGSQTKTATAVYSVIPTTVSDEQKALTELMNEIAALNMNDYTAASWNAMKAVYDEAMKLTPDTAAPADYGKTYKDLLAAKDALVTKAAELTAVKADADKALADVKATVDAGQSAYTNDSWTAFKEAYDALVAGMANGTLTAEQLRTLLAALTNAQAALVKGTSVGTVVSGQIEETASGRYQVINAAKKTAKLVQAKNKNKASITIPAQVTINGVKCKVVQVGANAFKGFKKLKKITLTKNITTIGKQAFYGCTKLSSVVVKGTGLKAIKSGAFKKTSKKMTVTFKSKKVKASNRKALLKKMKKAGMSASAKVK